MFYNDVYTYTIIQAMTYIEGIGVKITKKSNDVNQNSRTFLKGRWKRKYMFLEVSIYV